MTLAKRVAQLAVSEIFLLLVIAAALASPPLSKAEDSQVPRHLAPSFSNPIYSLPLAFERYKCQDADDNHFVSRTPNYTILLEPRQVTIAFRRTAEHAQTKSPSFEKHAPAPFVRMRLLHANPASVPVPEESLLGKLNYFIGNDPTKWRVGVPLFGRVRFRSVYKNVDLVYYGNKQQLEYDFLVRPGGRPEAIGFSITETSGARIDDKGDLVLETSGARATLRRPGAYQIVHNHRRDIAASFVLFRANRIGIRVASYDRNVPLVIDPVLAYSTYLGGSDDEGIFGIAFDHHGNIYVAGETSSHDFPQEGGVQNHLGGIYDAFVSKFDEQGANLIYSTYLGGSKYDHAIGIQVDEHGSAYIAGITQSSDFPVKNARQPALAGPANGFVAKLSPSGSELVFSTYLGGQGYDEITALALDHENAIYVAGSTSSLNFPTTTNAFQKRCDGGVNQGFCIGDAFVAKFDPSGRRLVYSTYLGGKDFDAAAGLAVNERGEAYVAGQASSTDFPTKNPFQSSLLGSGNAFVTKLNASGSALVFSTFLGGTGFDAATDVALDGRGYVYVTGTTASTDFPLARAFQSTNKGGFSDGFITKFNPRASQLVYSTYYGGSGWDYPFRIAVNRSGEAALIGFTGSTDFPTFRALYPSYRGGMTDAFVVLLDSSGEQPRFSTYLGGTGDEFGYAISTGCGKSVWVGGSTSSKNFPLERPFQAAYGGGPFDAFLSRILNDDDPEQNFLQANEGNGLDCVRDELKQD